MPPWHYGYNGDHRAALRKLTVQQLHGFLNELANMMPINLLRVSNGDDKMISLSHRAIKYNYNQSMKHYPKKAIIMFSQGFFMLEQVLASLNAYG